ncbi:TPA: hypothetical protein QCI09_002410 [Enterobacter ludwigii]|uniref:hypothetical protein n=1 Tax=Enterobacter ludwigii TaxID=299767 RepID=UPI001C8C519C|nr:hypothetical protein [Enterobacter ludwigii]MBX8877381.1 hypothetical protein [Enterobacter ludwigii]HDR2560611.1 hypothetical protein [Enterobacter ludwigii]HDR2579049.1 hypothetical protein [Enterobacter ludwigii]HDT2105447.1 hypothetical protein [Enterobacter roggenkampii]
MKVYRNDQEDDLWCEYGSAYETIRAILNETYPPLERSEWSLDKAYVSWRGDSYTVSATFTRFDEEVKDVVMVGCNAEGSRRSEDINTVCGKPIRVEYDFWKKEYSPKVNEK